MAEEQEVTMAPAPEADENIEKAAKSADKKADKKKGKDKAVDEENIEDEEKVGFGTRLIMGFVGLIIILIWLAIFALLVKMDVGGFGSTVLFPVLKDVPYVNMILPGIEEYMPKDEEGPAYETVDEAVARIKELEQEIEDMKAADADKDAKITEADEAAKELAEYKSKETAFEEEKEKFYEEVVFSDNAPDINTYKSYYESIEPENAEAIYKQVVLQLQEDEEIEDYVKAYSSMKPKNAAAIFDSMTDDLDLVCQILSAMDASSRSDILAAMDESNAAIVTTMMEP